MDPKARECCNLGSARNHPRVSKSLFVHTGKVLVARNDVWLYVRSGRSSTAHFKPSVGGEGNESGQDRDASAEDRKSVS